MKTIKLFSLTLIAGLLYSAVSYAQEVPLSVFLMQVIEGIKSMGGLDAMGVVALVLNLLISSMRVSVLAKYTWDKLNDSVKPLLAPVLGLLLGLFVMGKDLSLGAAAAYLFAGAGAAYLHTFIDGLKKLPGLGKWLVALIDLIEAALPGNK
jgi:hypothetical protein